MTNASSIAIVCALACLAPAVAHAQSADAEALFQDGRALLKQGKLDEACAKLEASEHLEASVGTLLNLADCRDKRGQVASAWATFLEAAGLAHRAGNDERREKEAARRAHALEPRVPYLTVSVPTTSQVEGLTIARGGDALDPALWNTAAPVDPGHYEITAQAPGREPWTTEVDLAEGQRVSIEVPRFRSVKEMTPPPSEPPPGEPPPSSPAPVATTVASEDRMSPPIAVARTTRPRDRWTGTRKLALGTAVFSLASAGVAIWRGVLAGEFNDASDALCPSATCDDPTGLDYNRTARRDGLEAEVLFVTSGVAAVGAAVLWFVGAPHAVEVTPVDGGTTLSFAGRF